MNERIKQLIKEMGIIPEDEHFEVAVASIKECISLFDGSREMKTVDMLSHDQIIKQIKEHFGIK